MCIISTNTAYFMHASYGYRMTQAFLCFHVLSVNMKGFGQVVGGEASPMLIEKGWCLVLRNKGNPCRSRCFGNCVAKQQPFLPFK